MKLTLTGKLSIYNHLSEREKWAKLYEALEARNMGRYHNDPEIDLAVTKALAFFEGMAHPERYPEVKELTREDYDLLKAKFNKLSDNNR